MSDDRPPGWNFNPSSWSHRIPSLWLALTGCTIATYLSLYQLDILKQVWEPFFQNGSTVILKESSIAHMLPVPDALLGAIVYLIDAILHVMGGPSRWRTSPWIVLSLGIVAASLALGGVFLAIAQPTLFHAFCTLCLASAACSLLMVWPVMVEVRAAWQHVQRAKANGQSFWQAVCGTPASKGLSQG